MEKMPDTILDIVRLDAITKLKNSNLRTKEEQNKVIGAAKDIMKLADLARKEGLLALEDIALCAGEIVVGRNSNDKKY